MISAISDSTTAALHAALNGLTQRQEAIASNMANLETPGYLAREVNFEDSLRAAIADGDPSGMVISTGRSLAATRTNGNNVNIDMEILANAETVRRQKQALHGVNPKDARLRTAISGR